MRADFTGRFDRSAEAVAVAACRPRQWGACSLVLSLWEELRLDRFWSERLPANRKGTRRDQKLFVLVAHRLVAPGSEWRLHREWFEWTALADLLGGDFGLAEIHKLYRCHDRLLEHKEALFDHLTGRWRDLFAARFDLLLYDLTSTYFEAEPPFAEGDKRRFGYSRCLDRRCLLQPLCRPRTLGLLAARTTSPARPTSARKPELRRRTIIAEAFEDAPGVFR
jgi:hypothetical protein